MPIKIAAVPVSWASSNSPGRALNPHGSPSSTRWLPPGTAGTELGPYGFLPTDLQVLKAALASRGLRLLSAFIPVRLVDKAAHAAGLETARKVGALLAACGCRHIVLSDDNAADPNRLARAGRITAEDGLGEEGWGALVEGVDLIARQMKGAFSATRWPTKARKSKTKP